MTQAETFRLVLYATFFLLIGGSMAVNGIMAIRRQEILVRKDRGNRLFTLRPRWVSGQSAHRLGSLYIAVGTIVVLNTILSLVFQELRWLFIAVTIILLITAMLYTLAKYEEAGE